MPFLQYHMVISIIAGFLLDALIGDPAKLPHPVQGIGAMISFWEKRLLRKEDAPQLQRAKGGISVILVLVVSAALPALLLLIAFRIHPLAGQLLEILMCEQIMAARSLRDASSLVYRALKAGDTEQARYAVSMIVGRDTSVLDEKGITKAAVETVAENASDGVIAPLFYLAIGGPVLGFFYKAVNTMDSMIGYRNDRYVYYGTCAARLDDVLNFIPSRLSGVIMTAASFLCGLDGRHAWKIFRRDRMKHASPNSAQTESTCAGALNVQLAGDAVYFGKTVHKPYLGDPVREIESQDIVRANRLMYVTAVLSLILFGTIRVLLQVAL